MRNKLHTTAFWLVCSTMLASSPAFAQTPDIEQKIQSMQSEIQRMQSEMEQLKREARQAKEAAKAAQAKIAAVQTPAAPAEKDTGNNFKVTFDPAPKFESADGANSFKVGGFAQIDAAFFGDDIADHPDGTTVRRTRLNASGTIARDWAYKFENDFADNSSVITDMYLQYNGFKPVSITAGQFKEPFGLENLTSDIHSTFLERASLTAFVPDRNIGLMVSTFGKVWTLAAGVFGSNTGTASTNDESQGITARATFAPIANSDTNTYLHLGIAGSYRTPDQANDAVRYRSRPESRLTSIQSVDTGNINNTDNTKLLGLESAFVYGPFALQGEYMAASIDRYAGTDVTIDGYYAEASYFLTGETRNYQPSKGRFEQVKVLSPFDMSKGTWGAWQIAARYSNLDLNDSPVFGGEMKNVTLGLKWIPQDHLRVMANYIKADTDGNAVVANDGPDIWTMRLQFDF